MLEISAHISKFSSHSIVSSEFLQSMRERTNYKISRGRKNSKRGTDERELDSIRQDIRNNNSERSRRRRKKSTERRQIIKWNIGRRGEKRGRAKKRNGTKRAGKETPENFLRRLTDFALRRVLAVSCES